MTPQERRRSKVLSDFLPFSVTATSFESSSPSFLILLEKPSRETLYCSILLFRHLDRWRKNVREAVCVRNNSIA